MDLSGKTCIPCHGKTPPLNLEAANLLLVQINKAWIINSIGHLYRKFSFKNFGDAMNFANDIAKIAEQEQHHPDLSISWGVCAVEIWTHKINGLSESDFYLAAKIDKLALD